jgi:CubicO group peptidase (beta-lactamase class C family)
MAEAPKQREEVDVRGHCDPAFEAIREALGRNMAAGEVGEAVALYADGELKVDLWAGHRDARRSSPWEADTLLCMFSVGKPVAILAVLMLADRGEIDLDAPVAEYWPEYARNGKEATTVRHVVTHMAGLPGVEGLPGGSAYDWGRMVAAIEEAKPYTVPGENGCYHSFTMGHLTGELVRRVTGCSIDHFIRAEINAPLDIECLFGMSEAERSRCADIVHPEVDPWMDAVKDQDTLLGRIWTPLLDGTGEDFNSERFRSLTMPAYNCHSNPRSMARLFAALLRGGELDGCRLLAKELAERFTREEVWSGTDILGFPLRMSHGFMLSNELVPFSTARDAFGHLGLGGAFAFADPGAGIACSFAPNRFAPEASLGPYSRRLIEAVRTCCN